MGATNARPENWKKKERWKKVQGYGNLYSVSNMGRIRTNYAIRRRPNKQKYQMKRKLLSPVWSCGVLRIGLRDMEGNRKWLVVKDLVAAHHINPKPIGHIVYKDRKNYMDCSVYNLKEKGKTRFKNAKLSDAEVIEMKTFLHDHWGEWGFQSKAAKRWQISPPLISLVCSGLRWPDHEPFLPPEMVYQEIEIEVDR